MRGLIELEHFFVGTSVYKSFGLLFSIVFCMALFPVTSHAQVLLSEIAWMGTDADANNEWIEIYNFGTAPMDLTGWTLTSIDGSIAITLVGTLQPHAVGVLERTDDTTLPGITALLTYTGVLANGGTTLTLKDGNGVVSDQAIGGSNWEGIGGNNAVPKKTPQRTRTGSWITASPTPGSENTGVGEVSTTTNNTLVTTHKSTPSKSITGGGGGGSPKTLVTKKDGSITNPVLTLAFDTPHIVYVNQKVNFEAEPSGVGTTIMDSLQYTWNFGDTYTGNGKKTEHSFVRPGEYVVVLQGMYAKHSAMVRHEVTVLPTVFEITRASNGDLVIQNKSPEEVDLGGFSLGLKKEFVFPPYTFVKAGGSLTVPADRFKNRVELVSLLDAKGVTVAYEETPSPSQVAKTALVLRKPALQTLVSDTSLPTQETEIKIRSDLDVQTTDTTISPKGETVIQIGREAQDTTGQGFVRKLFQKITSLFSF